MPRTPYGRLCGGGSCPRAAASAACEREGRTWLYHGKYRIDGLRCRTRKWHALLDGPANKQVCKAHAVQSAFGFEGMKRGARWGPCTCAVRRGACRSGRYHRVWAFPGGSLGNTKSGALSVHFTLSNLPWLTFSGSGHFRLSDQRACVEVSPVRNETAWWFRVSSPASWTNRFTMTVVSHRHSGC